MEKKVSYIRKLFMILTVFLAGCSQTDSQKIRECAEASALEADTSRDYSKLLERTDPALGEIHINQAAQALQAATVWRDQVCKGLYFATERGASE